MRESNRQAIENWIVEHVPVGARVLDIGCGDGSLLARLVREKNVAAAGIELSEKEVMLALQKGLSVHHGDAEEGLDHYPDQSFDVVVLSLTIQELGHPQRLLQETFRVGRQVVVAFPNFAHWSARWQLAVHGRAPHTPCLPYTWYESPNRHYLSILDWEEFCEEQGWQVVECAFIANGCFIKLLPNLRAEAAIYLLEKKANAQPGN